MTAPGLLVSAVRSGSGKTTVALGLMRAFARRGLCVGAAKCGPDYIDPAFHAAATGRESFNLDSWTMDAGLVARLAARVGAGADIVIAEGAMGLFDGAPGEAKLAPGCADVLREEDIWDVEEYFQRQLRRAEAKIFTPFWERFAIAARRLSLKERAELFSILWAGAKS